MDEQGSDKKIKQSSAYKDILHSMLPMVMPLMVLNCLILIARGSSARLNSSGLTQQPCLVPRPSLKDDDLLPLVRIAEVGLA